MSEPIKIPQSLHVFTEDCEPGDTIVLFERDKDGGYAEVGHVFNAEDFPCLEEEQLQEAHEVAVAIAEKIVRSYNSFDDLVAALQGFLDVAPSEGNRCLYCDARVYGANDTDEHSPDCEMAKGYAAIAKAKGETA